MLEEDVLFITQNVAFLKPLYVDSYMRGYYELSY